MTAKRLRFCYEYIVDGDANAAAIRAKFSERTAKTQASFLLTIIEIQEKIAELQAEILEKNKLSIQKVLDDIETIKNECMADKDRKNSLKALEMQGKYLKMFTDRIEHTGNIGVTVKIVDDIG